MKVLYALQELPADCSRPVATIGNFDGVHLGHQELMRGLVCRAKKIQGIPTVITFHPHPLRVLAPDNAPRQIQTLDQKLAMMRKLGIGLALVIPFDREFAKIRAREFAGKFLGELLKVQEIYVGPNFAFGCRREGSFSLLKEVGAEVGYFVGKIHQIQFRGSRVSSTAIRQALFAGQVSLARRLLGRPFALDGEIVHGAAIGATIGVPTANLNPVNELIPRNGVYVSTLVVEGRRYQGVTNIGVRPTLNREGSEPETTIETHMLDARIDLYGRKASLELLLYLREERRFENLEVLAAQIRKDVRRARRYLDEYRNRAPKEWTENIR
jgi:riboflavin kinase/FMN adenylyltransferase